MKNFLEAQAIKDKLQLKIVLELKAVDICPLTLLVNDQVKFYGGLVGNNCFIYSVNLTDPISIKMIIDRQHPQAVEIINFSIDGYEILPKYLNWANPATNYLDFTGIWRLEIPNFYPWYHQITGQGWIA